MSSVLVLRQICSPVPIVTSLTEVAVELMMMLEWSVKVVKITIHVANSNLHDAVVIGQRK